MCLAFPTPHCDFVLRKIPIKSVVQISVISLVGSQAPLRPGQVQSHAKNISHVNFGDRTFACTIWKNSQYYSEIVLYIVQYTHFICFLTFVFLFLNESQTHSYSPILTLHGKGTSEALNIKSIRTSHGVLDFALVFKSTIKLTHLWRKFEGSNFYLDQPSSLITVCLFLIPKDFII